MNGITIFGVKHKPMKSKHLLVFSLGILIVLGWTSCSKTTIYTGSSQTGVFYNKLALGVPGSGGAGFSPKRRYKDGKQIVPLPIYHTVGGSFLMGLDKDVQYGYPGGGIHYDLRITAAKWSNEGTFSINFPLTMGITYHNDFVQYPNPALVPQKKTNFTAEVPINFTFNFGHCATPKSLQNFGGFFGVGYAFAYLPSGRTGTYIFPSGTNYNLPIGHGPHGRVGIRFRTGSLSWQTFGSFMYNIYTPSHLAGVGVGLTFGK